MGSQRVRYDDRLDAGRRLAVVVRELDPPADLLVLGLPRGGVVVAREVVIALAAELDVLVVRKVAHPSRPELALGAVSAHGSVRNDAVLSRLGVAAAAFDALAAVQLGEVRRRERLFRPGRPPLALTGRAVLIVDDGLATGATARAAVEAVRGQAPLWLGLAAPVAPAGAVAVFAAGLDCLAVPFAPPDFSSVSRYYRDFPQTTDDEVREILAAVR